MQNTAAMPTMNSLVDSWMDSVVMVTVWIKKILHAPSNVTCWIAPVWSSWWLRSRQFRRIFTKSAHSKHSMRATETSYQRQQMQMYHYQYYLSLTTNQRAWNEQVQQWANIKMSNLTWPKFKTLKTLYKCTKKLTIIDKNLKPVCPW